jgi:hypothetical protein
MSVAADALDRIRSAFDLVRTPHGDRSLARFIE